MKVVDGCIFCGARPQQTIETRLSREHIFAEWIQDHVPRIHEFSSHWVTRNGSEPEKGVFHNPGDMLSKRLKIVCKPCNSIWMSALQVEAQEFLKALFRDEWPPLKFDDQLKLARWVAMFAMVVEYDNPPTASVPQAHRTTLKGGGMPEDWRVWIGRHNPSYGQNAQVNQHHFTGGRQALPPMGPFRVVSTRSTAFTVGSLLVLAIMETPGHPTDLPLPLDPRFDLRQIWPYRTMIDAPPTTVHGKDGFDAVGDYFANVIGLPVMKL